MDKNESTRQRLIAHYTPDPATISTEINEEVLSAMKTMIAQGTLDYYTMLSYFEDAVAEMQIDRARIAAHYIINLVQNTASFDEQSRAETIDAILLQLHKLATKPVENELL